jgi:uncharacterized protein YndB with AHSA1/START domain
MGTTIGPLAVRRSIWIDAKRARVWRELESFERMRDWFGTGHTLVRYEPRVGGIVEVDAGTDEQHHDVPEEGLRFVGAVVVFDPPHELTFEQDWVGRGWPAPALMTIRLTEIDAGTLVEMFHHGFERMGAAAAELHRGFEAGWGMRQLEALHAHVEG